MGVRVQQGDRRVSRARLLEGAETSGHHRPLLQHRRPAANRSVRNGDPESGPAGAGGRADDGVRRRPSVAVVHPCRRCGRRARQTGERTKSGRAGHQYRQYAGGQHSRARRAHPRSLRVDVADQVHPVRGSVRIGVRGHAAARPRSEPGERTYRLRAAAPAGRDPDAGDRLLPAEMSGCSSAWYVSGRSVYWNATHMKSMIFGAAIVFLSAATASADVQLSLQNGRVTIVAKDASVRQILTEWARVGKTKIVNVERIPGGPLTLELHNVPETQALDILMRTLSGYITAPRAEEAANLSQFDRIIVMPTIASARPAAAAPPPPVFQQQPTPQFTQPPLVDDDADDERPAAAPNAAAPPNVVLPPNVNVNRGPVFGQPPRGPEIAPQGVYPGMPPGGFPQQQQQQQQQQPAPVNTVTPTSPFGGVAVPGMIVAPPQQPGQQPGQIQQQQPQQQQQPGQPVRRPGGQN